MLALAMFAVQPVSVRFQALSDLHWQQWDLNRLAGLLELRRQSRPKLPRAGKVNDRPKPA